MKPKNRTCLAGVILSAIAICGYLAIASSVKHRSANSSLITAIREHDASKVVAALALGAEANARYDHSGQTESFLKRLLKVLSIHPERDSRPTVLMLVFELEGVITNDGSGFRTDPSDIAVALLDHGADPNVVCERGWDSVPVLIHATSEHYEQCIRVLLEHGANPNATDRNGNTALAYVSTIGAAKELIGHGANPNWRNKEGWSVLDLVSQSPYTSKALMSYIESECNRKKK